MPHDRDPLREAATEGVESLQRAPAGPAALAPDVEMVLRLQATAGNQAVGRLISASRTPPAVARNGRGGDGTTAVAPALDEEAIRSKAAAHVEPDFEAPVHSAQDVEEIKGFLRGTVVASGQATPQEVDETLDDVDRDIVEARQEKAREAVADVPAETAEDDAEEEQGQDPVAVVAELEQAQGGAPADEERDSPMPPASPGPSPASASDAAEAPAQDLEALGKASDEELDLVTDLVAEQLPQLGVAPKSTATVDELDALLEELAALVAASQAARTAAVPASPGGQPPPGPPSGPPPGPPPSGPSPGPPPSGPPPGPPPSATAPVAAPGFFGEASPDGPSGVVDTFDKLLGPSAEASASFPFGQTTALTGGLTGKTTEGGQGFTSGAATGSDAFFTGFTSTLDAVGGLARVVNGIKRTHAGRKAGNRAEVVGGLLDVLNGFGTAVKSGAGTVAKGMGDAAPKALNAFGAIAGVVLSTITTIRYGIATGKAFRRKGRVRELQHDYERKAAGAYGKDPAEFDFYRRMRAAAFVMKHKSGRRFWKRLIGTGGAGVGIIAGIAAGVAVFTAANIWNPVGWALAAIGAGVALGLTAWAIYRYIRRRRNRKNLTERASSVPLEGGQKSDPIREEVAPSQYAEWIIDEATCSRHANADQHKAEIATFLGRVVGSKRAGKLLSMDKAKAVKELSKKFAS